MRKLLALMLVGFLSAASAQTPTAPAPPVPDTNELPLSGEIRGAHVIDVQVMTNSSEGPLTRFLIDIPDRANAVWFYVRSDDSVHAFERGGIVALLMGAAETYRATSFDFRQRNIHDGTTVNFAYVTVRGRPEIVAVSLYSKLQH